MASKNVYLYSVYRNDGDQLIALDVSSAEAIRLMGIKRNTFYRIISLFNGKNNVWTIVKTPIKVIHQQTEEGLL